MTRKRRALPYKLLDQGNIEANDQFLELQTKAAARIQKLTKEAEADPNEDAFVSATTDVKKV